MSLVHDLEKIFGDARDSILFSFPVFFEILNKHSFFYSSIFLLHILLVVLFGHTIPDNNCSCLFVSVHTNLQEILGSFVMLL